MKNLKAITAIVTTITDKDFDKLNNAESDAYFADTAKERRNATKRRNYMLKKYNLTVDEWYAWLA